MRKKIKETIKAYYPSKIYRLPLEQKDTGLFDEEQRSNLADQVRKISKAEVEIEKDDEYGVSWNYGIFFPSKTQVYINKKKRRFLNTKPKYVLYVSISNLARYYMMYWNELKIVNGIFELRLLLRNPRSDLRAVEAKIRALVENHGFTRLSKKELNEQVKWLRAGKSAIRGIPTVYNCLFSEV